MVSFSLRQRISYPLLEDPTPVSFHLSQFADSISEMLSLTVEFTSSLLCSRDLVEGQGQLP